MGVEDLEHRQDADYGVAEKLDEGIYGIGRFQAVGESPEDGLALYGQDGDVEVRFDMSPRELLLLGDLVDKHRQELKRGLRREEAINSMQPVHINRGEGSDPIPTNKSALNSPPHDPQ